MKIFTCLPNDILYYDLHKKSINLLLGPKILVSNLLPPVSVVEVIESDPCLCVCLCVSVNTLTAKPFDL